MIKANLHINEMNVLTYFLFFFCAYLFLQKELSLSCIFGTECHEASSTLFITMETLILNAETSSPRYVVQNDRGMLRATSEITGNSIPIPSQIHLITFY